MPETKENPHRRCDQLAAYELGLLDNAQKAAFETHLHECDECLAEMYAHAPFAVAMTTDPGAYRRALDQTLAASRPTLWTRLAAISSRCMWPR